MFSVSCIRFLARKSLVRNSDSNNGEVQNEKATMVNNHNPYSGTDCGFAELVLLATARFQNIAC
jgi:hypothetical protein